MKIISRYIRIMNEQLRITLNSFRAVSGVGQTISNYDDFSHDLLVRGFSGNSSAILIQSCCFMKSIQPLHNDLIIWPFDQHYSYLLPMQKN